MVFKKKRSIRELLKAALIFIAFFGVPIWGFMILSITCNFWVGVGLVLWEMIGLRIMNRFG